LDTGPVWEQIKKAMTEQNQMSEQNQLGPSRDGSVMLDIGGDIGALVLHTSAEMLGVEIEISPTGDDTHHRSHVAVRERRGNGATRYAAIYPALRAGSYTLWRPDGQPALEVTVTGGAVAQAQWS
jgi:hypothetical protein